jgi:hypothetical protein
MACVGVPGPSLARDLLMWICHFSWLDGDLVIMNPHIPLEIFLPPEPEWSHIHALVTNDHHGLNNGVFFLRVHEWSVWLMAATVAWKIYKPNVPLHFHDQTALGHLLDTVSFSLLISSCGLLLTDHPTGRFPQCYHACPAALVQRVHRLSRRRPPRSAETTDEVPQELGQGRRCAGALRGASQGACGAHGDLARCRGQASADVGDAAGEDGVRGRDTYILGEGREEGGTAGKVREAVLSVYLGLGDLHGSDVWWESV